MRMHCGQLSVHETEGSLKAYVSLHRRRLRIDADSSAWSWPRRSVEVEHVSGDRFVITADGERFGFVALNPVMFIFDVADKLATDGRRRRGRRHTEIERVEAVPEPSVEAAVEATVASTDETERRDSLMDTLSSLADAEGAEHSHRWIDAEDHSDGIVQICADCQHVVVDLAAAETEEAPTEPAP